jgi:hypothetical protein
VRSALLVPILLAIGMLLAELAKVSPHGGVAAALVVGLLSALPIKVRFTLEVRDWGDRP